MRLSTIAPAIVIVFVLAIATGVYVFAPSEEKTITVSTTIVTMSESSSQTASLTTPASALVFGLMSTTGNGTQHTLIVFKSATSGHEYVVPVADGRSFSVQLPNSDVYNVTTHWVGKYYWQTGTVDRGTLTLNWGPGSKAAESFNVVDDTPNSLILANGTALSIRSDAKPAMIVFTSTNGLVFQAPVSLDGVFSISLPNMMNYTTSLNFQYQNETNAGSCSAGQMELNGGAGVAEVAQSFVC